MRKVINLVEPPVTSYPSIANIFSMKWKEKNEIMPWIGDHFIQLIIRQNHEDTPADFYDHADVDNYYRELYGMPWLSWMRINKETANFKKFTDYIEYQINNGYALEPCVDRYFFKFTGSYKKDHFIHSSFIYGYDNIKRKIYIADFWDYGKYERKEVSYRAINKSMNNNGIINLFKLQEGKYEFKPVLMKTFLEDYLNSEDSTHKFDFSNKKYNKDVIFGLSYYDYVLNYCSEKKYMDIRFFHVLYDHKLLMKLRLEFLVRSNYISESWFKKLSAKNDGLIASSLEVRNMVLKYNYSNSEELLGRVKENLQALKKQDKVFVSALLNAVNWELGSIK